MCVVPRLSTSRVEAPAHITFAAGVAVVSDQRLATLILDSQPDEVFKREALRSQSGERERQWWTTEWLTRSGTLL